LLFGVKVLNKVKDVFNDYNIITHGPVDPLNLSAPNGPWIIGSFALWSYLKHVKKIHVDWMYNDIDYIVSNEEQGDKLLKYFKNTKEPMEAHPRAEGIFKFGKYQVNINPYEDIRFRLHDADIDITQVATDNKNFYISKSALNSLENNSFRLTGRTFNLPLTNLRIEKYTKRGFVFKI
jgi:hypothetical protein